MGLNKKISIKILSGQSLSREEKDYINFLKDFGCQNLFQTTLALRKGATNGNKEMSKMQYS